ncbi:MAG TPA: PH domain-containing protein [Gemmataceae bacterium]|nr:PH domain-containing protein [Gemmataceae bacterium]
MHPATDATDPAEPDLYWAGHSGWAMLPSLVVGAIVWAIIMLGAPPVGNLIGLPSDWTAFLTFWLVLLGWIGAAIDWSYRGAAFVYRLTPRRLYADFGVLYRPVPPIPLTEVTHVEHRAWALRRLFGVGSVIVHARGRPPLRLRGIFRPDRFADAIRAVVREAQAEKIQVTPTDLPSLKHPIT